jgi:hypothetical protein
MLARLLATGKAPSKACTPPCRFNLPHKLACLFLRDDLLALPTTCHTRPRLLLCPHHKARVPVTLALFCPSPTEALLVYTPWRQWGRRGGVDGPNHLLCTFSTAFCIMAYMNPAPKTQKLPSQYPILLSYFFCGVFLVLDKGTQGLTG